MGGSSLGAVLGQGLGAGLGSCPWGCSKVSKICEGREHETLGMHLQHPAAAQCKELESFQLSHLYSSFCPPEHVEPLKYSI